MTLSDRVVVMHHGVVQQVGTPLDVYNLPQNEFVAGFMGSPAMNFLTCHLHQTAEQLVVGVDELTWPIALDGASSAMAPPRLLTNRQQLQGALTLGIRPEDITLTTTSESNNGLPCRIMLVEHMGATNLFYVDLQVQRLVVTTEADFYLPPATNAVLHFNPAKIHFFAVEGGRNLTL